MLKKLLKLWKVYVHAFTDGRDTDPRSAIGYAKETLEAMKEAGVGEFATVSGRYYAMGRDTDPRSAIGYAKETLEAMKEAGVGEFATVSGRYYAMHRDNRWERVELAYNAMVKGEWNKSECILDAIEKSYADDINDEFIVPTVIEKDGEPVATIKEKSCNGKCKRKCTTQNVIRIRWWSTFSHRTFKRSFIHGS